MKITRRLLTSQLAILGVISGAGCFRAARPSFAFVHQTDLERLQADLNKMIVPNCRDTVQIEVLSGQQVESRTDPVTLDATIRLNWPPGLRQRLYSGAGSTAQDAYSRLVAKVREDMESWLPDCIQIVE